MKRKLKLNRSKRNISLLSKRRNKLLKNATVAERYIESLLVSLGEKFIAQKGFLSTTKHYIVDFYLPKRHKLCLEIDGFHHRTEPQRTYDAIRDRFLIFGRGFRVIRIPNEAAVRMTADQLSEVIKA